MVYAQASRKEYERNKLEYMRNWLIHQLTIADQQQHIERSEDLLRTVQAGDPATLYWSMAQPAGLVLGFSQKDTTINPVALAAGSFPIYHRRAGGTAVLVGPTLLCLDVILPADHPLHLEDLVESYRWFGEAWVQTFSHLGLQTRIVTPDEAHAQRDLRKQPDTMEYELLMNRACYGTLSPYEVVFGRRKVVGLDMIRRRAGTLLQAGVLLHWETETLAHLLGHTREEQEILQKGLLERAVGLDLLLGRVADNKEVMDTFERVVISDKWQRLTASTSISSI
jgi:lipoate---protein ligase